jgi:hypothetical protein
MHGKNSKFAIAALSALLYAQGLLIVAGVAFVVIKDRSNADQGKPTLVASAAPSGAQLR